MDNHALEMITVGIISDTHGLLRQEAIEALQGSDYILHGGDIGKQSVIDQLAEIAPVTAIRGNVDKGELATRYPHDTVLTINETSIYTIHILDELKIDPVAAGYKVVVYGHSHKPSIETRDGVLYLNPGSAGPRRFSLPVTVARLSLQEAEINAQLVELLI